ncbi:SusC/RagA family TonB-linked outer membrane protein [Larkinella soli]|uniref:SusC/RagA family TonB-linked outer membrane protein n=1 Tax=Larkinella soli TaxID=1770527 RepID=UPI001E58433A|nr:TonB-dependent receptor [Larkinella soli]
MLVRLAACGLAGLLTGGPQAQAATSLQKRAENPKGAQTLKQYLRDLESRHGVHILYNARLIGGLEVPAQFAPGQDVESTLSKLLVPLNLKVEKIKEGVFVVSAPKQAVSEPLASTGSAVASVAPQPFVSTGTAASAPAVQERTVSGRVVSSEDNNALPGVNIAVKGTTRGTTTDAEGQYRLAVPNDQAVLVFSSVGFLPQEVTVGNRSTIDLKLAVDTRSLTEVVVVGYGTQKKSQLTGAISSVGSKEIAELPITNARQALQGRAAGVDVVQNSSKPGAGPTVRIRGRRSINASNDPLYVVDGIPLAGSIDDINPNDIASMEVLKDASATAIYGSRGSNGVVLITTKRGKPGKTVVSYDGYYGISDRLGQIDVMNGPEFAEYKRESRRAVNEYPAGVDAAADAKLFEAVELDGIAKNRTTDYQSYLLRQGNIQSHQIGVQGGSEKTQFAISGNYFKDVGIVKNQDFTRYTFRVNLDHQISPKIKIGTSTLGVYSLRNGENFNPLGGSYAENPLGKPYDDQGNLIFLPTQDGLRTNPIAEIIPGAQIDLTKRMRIFNSLYGEWNIIDGLKYRVNFGPDLTNRRVGRFVGSQTNARRGADPTAFSFNEYQFNWTLENILTYSKTFKQVHNLNFTALQSVQKDDYETNQIDVTGIPAESQQFYNLGQASLINSVGSNVRRWVLNSYMGRVNYDYNDKYLLTLTARYDGSSRFGENTKYGFFPSAAIGWNISNESFLKPVTWIDNLKLRASYGTIGSTAIDPYQTQAQLARTTYAFGSTGAFGYRPFTISNPDLKWETTTTGNIGLDFSLFRGRVSGSLEYYRADTRDLLLFDQLPLTSGFDRVLRNVGKTRNQGIELTLSTVNVDAPGGFRWTTDLQFTRNRESILELFNGKVDDVGNSRFIGQPLTAYFDYKKIGIWQTNEADEAKRYQSAVGQIKIQDTNGDGKIDPADRVILGSQVPKWSAGITNRFEFKGFDLSFFVFARVGYMFRSIFHQDFLTLAGRYNSLDVDYWSANNPTNEFPRPNKNQEFPPFRSTLLYFDGTFVKIRNINVGYNLPSKISDRLKLGGLRVFASIQQPFIFSEYRTKYKGIDSETDGDVNADQSPAVRQTTFGINLKF